ncbi:GNAT family N-acetyltransferase [Ectobacillus ponti]|uniref:GNAT family N-acetyltransferase n=1 Tax=Ectobacillus ponti TaxID=2961894 RepID=A0AA41X4S0_9BACI|nr:GNAT family N-acetyltransferase [Ectobacillus ponti]MCP8968916.1 GNAT family N-acetyltransferase [Ectobacillus ponti]
MKVQLLQTEEELLEALPVLRELRPHLTEESFGELLAQMKLEGYRLFALRNDAGRIVSLAGTAIMTNFYNRKHVFVYDLVTAESERSKGYGEVLLAAVEAWGREDGCEAVSLTSGLQRTDAHRFYEREGYAKTSFAFRKSL